MNDEIWKRKEIQSPCVKVCVIHTHSGYCMGCYRTGSEIAAWNQLDDATRENLISTLHLRKDKIKGRRRSRGNNKE